VSINASCVAHTSVGRRPCGWRRFAVPVRAPPEALEASRLIKARLPVPDRLS